MYYNKTASSSEYQILGNSVPLEEETPTIDGKFLSKKKIQRVELSSLFCGSQLETESGLKKGSESEKGSFEKGLKTLKKMTLCHGVDKNEKVGPKAEVYSLEWW